MADDGSFAVVYQNSDLGEIEFDVKMNLFSTEGEPLGEFDLNTYTESEQREPDLAAVGSRGYMTVWHSLGQEGDGSGVFARRFLGPGMTDPVEFSVPHAIANSQHRAAVSANEEIILVAWQHTGVGMDYQLKALVLPVP